MASSPEIGDYYQGDVQHWAYNQFGVISRMNQEEPEFESKWAQQLDLLSEYIATAIGFLESYANFVAARAPTFRHPSNTYIKAWKTLQQKLSSGIQRFRESRVEVLLSTIINWCLPSLASAYNDLYVYIQDSIRESELKGDTAQLSQQQIKEIHQQFSLQGSFGIKKVALEPILKVPMLYIDRLLQRLVIYSEALEMRLVSCSSVIEQSVRSELQGRQRQICILEIECRELQQSLRQFNSYLQFLNQEDKEGRQVNRDNTVLRFTIVSKQYPQIPRNKTTKFLGFRLKLICRWKKLEKRIVQRRKERKMKILELIDGEQRYIAGLKEYIAYVKDPIEAVGVLNEEERRLLFSSITQIRDFHEGMLQILKKEFDSYSDEQCYGAILRKFIPFFKLYTDYILNATAAQKKLQDLCRTSKEVGQICRRYTEGTQKIAHNELSQPTFRIARYEMLFEGIIKSTAGSHPDRKQLTDALHHFKTILTQVNNEVDKIIRRNRLNQLEQEYGSICPIYSDKRQFLTEYSLLLIKDPRPEPVNLVICTDLILIVDEETQKLQRVIKVDENFFARREEDNKIFRNMVTIHSDGFTTFSSGSEDINANRAEEVYQVLKKITRDTGQQVVVQVLGTQEIGSTSFAKYTEYIIEVKYLDLKKLLHMRFSLVSEMVEVMQAHYQDPLKINEEDSLKKSWFNSHKSKIIEARKIIIAQIFMKLFNHPVIKADPAFFLKYLDLPENFYEVARTSYEKRISMGQSVTVSGLKRSYLTRKEEKEAFTILCATEIELGRDLFHDNDASDELRKTKEQSEKVEIEILTLVEAEPVRIRITEFDTVEDACNKVSTLIGLRSNRDFRLFHEIGKKELRVLDHEQVLAKIFEFPRQQNVIIVGFVETIKSTLQKIVSPKTLPTLVFKKYYHLPYEIEQAQFRKDLTRLKLMTSQVFSDICDMKYQLTFDEYLLFLAMLVYIHLEGKVDRRGEVDPQIVHRVIPPTVFKLKNYSEEEWLGKSGRHLSRVHEEIEKVIEYNRAQLHSNRIKADTVSKMALYFGQKHLCSQIVLNKIRGNPIFGSNIFYVQPHSSCYRKLEEEGLKVAYNMWLAVKVESLSLLTPSSKESIFELKYTDIEKVEVYSESVVIRKAGTIEVDYRFNTYQSFEISQLIKYCKTLCQTMGKLKESKELNARVKSYRDQLLEYRFTVEEESLSLIK